MSTLPQWHDDPTAPGSGRQRYWDGAGWTDWVMDPGASMPRMEPSGDLASVAAGARRRRPRPAIVAAVAGGAVLLLGVGAVAIHLLSDLVEQQVADIGAVVGGDDDLPVTVEGDAWFEQAYMDYVDLSTEGTEAEEEATTVGRDALVERGRELCASTDSMDEDEFADYYESLVGAAARPLDAVLVEAAQYYLCDVDQMSVYWDDYFADDADAGLPDVDDAEATYLWVLDSYDLGLDDAEALEAGYWVCDRLDAHMPEADTEVYQLILDAGETFDLDDVDASILFGTAGTLCPDLTAGLYATTE